MIVLSWWNGSIADFAHSSLQRICPMAFMNDTQRAEASQRINPMAVLMNRCEMSESLQNPESIVCAKCGTNLGTGLRGESARHPHWRYLLLFGLLGGLLMLGCLPIAGIAIAWVISGPGGPSIQSIRRRFLPSQRRSSCPTTTATTAPPPDPRLKIVQPAVDKGLPISKPECPT